MAILTGNKIDWSTCQKMMSKIDNDQLVYTGMYELDKYGNKETFRYNKSLGKNLLCVPPNNTKAQITCLNTKDSFNGKGEIISWVYKTAERNRNGEDKEYYIVFFLSMDMYELANLINDICLKVSAGEVKLLYKDEVNDMIPLYRNENDIEFEDVEDEHEYIFHIKEYFISPELSKPFTLYEQIKRTSEILEEILNESLSTKDFLIRNIRICTEQKAVLYVKNGDGCLYTANNKSIYMKFGTLSDLKKLNDNKDITKIKFHIEDEDINSTALSFASKIVLNLIDDESYIKKNTYYTSEPHHHLQFYLTDKILINNFLNKKESSLVLIKDVPADARIFIEKRIEDRETKYLMVITNNNNNLLCYYNDEIKDFVDILLYFKNELNLKFES